MFYQLVRSAWMCGVFLWKHSKGLNTGDALNWVPSVWTSASNFASPKRIHTTNCEVDTLSYTNWMQRFWIIGWGGGFPMFSTSTHSPVAELKWEKTPARCLLLLLWQTCGWIVLFPSKHVEGQTQHCFQELSLFSSGACKWLRCFFLEMIIIFYYIWLITCHCFTEVGLQWEESGDF